MSDETALLRAIAAHPDEDTPRLAYADWLDEHRPAKPKRTGGKTRTRAEPGNSRAAFIRGQIELARLKDDSPHRREVAFRCRQLLDAHEEKWLDPREAFGIEYGWSRGFVETIMTTTRNLVMGEGELFATNPFRRLWMWRLAGTIQGVELIPKENKLTALDLMSNNLNVNELKKLAKMTHLPHLRELGLMFNALRDTSVKVLCGEPFFQRLELIRLGANPFTDRGRDQLREHFGDRVTFAHDREPDRLYALQDDRLRVGWGADLTQFFMLAGEERQRIAVFDHAGNLLRKEERDVPHAPDADYHTRSANRVAARDKWLQELGYKSATIKVKRFQFADGVGLTPFNWWADVFDGREPSPHGDMRDSVERWLEQGQYRINFGHGDNWFERSGEVTDT